MVGYGKLLFYLICKLQVRIIVRFPPQNNQPAQYAPKNRLLYVCIWYSIITLLDFLPQPSGNISIITIQSFKLLAVRLWIICHNNMV